MRELRRTEKLIITVAQTGAFHGKEANPNLPLDPEEIAQSAYDCWNEGASIVHVHARDRVKREPTGDPDVFREIDQRIREKCDIILQHSTSTDFIPRFSSDKRIKSIESKPEMATLNVMFSSMNVWGKKPEFNVFFPEDIEYGAKVLLERGIKPEIEIYNYVNMHDVYRLIEKGLLAKPYWIDFIFNMLIIHGNMPYVPDYLFWLVNMLPPDSMFNVIGIGPAQLPATTLSILLGGHLRVGFEDNIYYKKGQLAESNAQLVARAVRIGKELGCEIATPDEARQMLGIPKLRKQGLARKTGV